MVVWQWDEKVGSAKMTWRPQGYTDFGIVKVIAMAMDDAWKLECEIPGWDSRPEEWQLNATAQLSQYGISAKSGLIQVRLEATLTPAQMEIKLARAASMLGALATALTYMRNTPGKRKLGVPDGT